MNNSECVYMCSELPLALALKTAIFGQAHSCDIMGCIHETVFPLGPKILMVVYFTELDLPLFPILLLWVLAAMMSATSFLKNLATLLLLLLVLVLLVLVLLLSLL